MKEVTLNISEYIVQVITYSNNQDKGVIAKVADDPSVCDMVTDTMDSILDMLGREINDEERKKLASQIEIVHDSEQVQ